MIEESRRKKGLEFRGVMEGMIGEKVWRRNEFKDRVECIV